MGGENKIVMGGEAEGRRAMLGTLFFCHLVNDYYFMIIPPLLPFFARDFHLTFFQSGMVIFVVNIVAAVLQPFVGYYSDLKMLRRRAIVIGLLLYALSYYALSFVPSYAFLVLVLVIMGLGGSTYHPQSTYFIARYFQKYRGTASGIHGAANPVGFLLAPIVVTVLIAVTGSWRSTATVMIIPGVIAALLSRFVLEEPQVKGSKGFLIGIRSGPLILLTLVSGLLLAITYPFLSFLPFYARDAASHIPASWWLPLTLVPGIAFQPLGGWIADKIGRRNLITLGLCILSVALLGFIGTAGGVALAFSMVAGGCFSLLVPVCLIYSAELAVGERVGTAVGVMWGFSTGMGAISPLWVGYLRDVFPDFRMAFMTLVVLAVAGAVMSFFLPGRERPQVSEI